MNFERTRVEAGSGSSSMVTLVTMRLVRDRGSC